MTAGDNENGRRDGFRSRDGGPDTDTDTDADAVEAAITSRRSVRAFTDRPVPRALVHRILEAARRAPSGTNMQPWSVHVLAGADKDRLSRAVGAAYNENGEGGGKNGGREYAYYPASFFEPYLSRRRAVGWGLYTLLGIEKGDKAAMHAQHARNFAFFDAPVGMIFTIDKRLELGSWLDYGMFLQNVMVAARGHGLDTCPQAAFAGFPGLIREVLGIDEGEAVVCGMALGYAEQAAPENTLVSEREPVEAFASFRGFPD